MSERDLLLIISVMVVIIYLELGKLRKRQDLFYDKLNTNLAKITEEYSPETQKLIKEVDNLGKQ